MTPYQGDVTAELYEKIAALEAESERRRRLLEISDDRVNRLSEQVAALEAENTGFRDAVETQEGVISGLLDENKTLKATAEDVSEAYHLELADAAERTREIEGLKARLAEAEERFNAEEKVRKFHTAAANAHQAQYEAANARADALGDQLAELRAKWPEVEAQSVHWIDRAESAEAEARRLREILRDVWDQFAVEKSDGTKWHGGLSTLKDVESALQEGKQ